MPERNPCRRCGTCCVKGPPALHLEDLPLLWDGALSKSDLCTLRIGEPVQDQILGAATLLETECVKIRTAPEGSTCIFFQNQEAACLLYAHRPLECRALKCWDTAELAEVYGRKRLTRLDVIHAHGGLAELVREHEARCGCAKLLEWLGQGTVQSRMALQEAQAYDAALRTVLAERTVLKAGMLPFLLGRPLDVVILGLMRWQSLCPSP